LRPAKVNRATCLRAAKDLNGASPALGLYGGIWTPLALPLFALAHDEDQHEAQSLYAEEQIIGILKEHEAGVSVADLCRKHGVSDASIYKVRRHGGLGGQAAEDAGGREHAAKGVTGRHHAGQCGFERPFGKELVTPAGSGKLSSICEMDSG
jgi:Transposase